MKKSIALFVTLIVFSCASAFAAPQPKVQEHVLNLNAQHQTLSTPDFTTVLGVTVNNGKAILVTREPQSNDGQTRTFDVIVVKAGDELPPATDDIPTYVGSVSVGGTLYHVFYQ